MTPPKTSSTPGKQVCAPRGVAFTGKSPAGRRTLRSPRPPFSAPVSGSPGLQRTPPPPSPALSSSYCLALRRGTVVVFGKHFRPACHPKTVPPGEVSVASGKREQPQVALIRHVCGLCPVTVSETLRWGVVIQMGFSPTSTGLDRVLPISIFPHHSLVTGRFRRARAPV